VGRRDASRTLGPEEHHRAGPVKLGDPYIEDFLSGVRERQDG
jgi:hyaluronoglucosaminidase